MTDVGPDTGHQAPPDTGPNPPPDTGTENAQPDTGTESDTDWKAEAEKWAEMARRHEARAKGNANAARELETLKQQAMTDTERAVAEAVTAARRDLATEFGGRLVDAEVRAAAVGLAVDVDTLLEGLDRRRFLTEEGEPNVRAIKTWMSKVAPKAAEATGPAPLDLGQGQRPGSPSPPNMNALLRHAAGHGRQ